jgi:hypothetical protein
VDSVAGVDSTGGTINASVTTGRTDTVPAGDSKEGMLQPVKTSMHKHMMITKLYLMVERLPFLQLHSMRF